MGTSCGLAVWLSKFKTMEDYDFEGKTLLLCRKLYLKRKYHVEFSPKLLECEFCQVRTSSWNLTAMFGCAAVPNAVFMFLWNGTFHAMTSSLRTSNSASCTFTRMSFRSLAPFTVEQRGLWRGAPHPVFLFFSFCVQP